MSGRHAEMPTPFRADGLCPRCVKRPATTDIGPVADWRHRTPSCEQCVVEEQLEHARERAAAIPELERRLSELTGVPQDRQDESVQERAHDQGEAR